MQHFQELNLSQNEREKRVYRQDSRAIAALQDAGSQSGQASPHRSPQRLGARTPPGAALDKSTSIASARGQLDESTGELKSVVDATLKWQLQAVARLALGVKHRLRICYRHTRPDWSEVQVRGAEDWRAYYAGLMTCGSVWVCPVCATKIQSVRASEVRRGIDAWAGVVLLLTLTVPHTRQDDLGALLGCFNDAYRRFTAGRAYKSLKGLYRLSGSVRALEVTYSDINGWHPHAHVLLFLEQPCDLEGLAGGLFERWQSATRRAGFGELSRSAFSLQDGSAVRTYVTKMGQEYLWGAEHELVKSHTKRGRGAARFTPFDFLRAYLLEPDEGRLLYLFGEFAAVFHGRNQLVWSRGFKRSLIGSDGLTDEQVADSIGELDPVLASISLGDWWLVRRGNLQAQVLQVVQDFGREGLKHLLEHHRGISQLSA